MDAYERHKYTFFSGKINFYECRRGILYDMSFFRSGKPNILFVATEAAPFVKAGGLGEVMFSLPRALARLGYDARVMIPRYAGIDLEKFRLEMVQEGLRVPTGADGTTDQEPAELVCNVKKYVSDGNGKSPTTTYFLENLEYFEKRSNIYGYNDDAIRWALLSRGVLEFIREGKDRWRPEIIVAADWQTGFLCNSLKHWYKDDPVIKKIATIFTIHNLYYQGVFDHRFVSEMDYDDGQSALPSFFDPRLLHINGMRRGIINADLVSTVSPHYAREIMTAEYGELLDGLLRERRARVYGVLNGIDYEEFNPETDPYIIKNYTSASLDEREKNKRELQSRFGLDQSKSSFVIGIVSRLSEQKGLDLLFPIADVLLRELKIQLAVLGTGEGKYMGFFQELEKKYPGRVGTNLVFDSILPHVVFAGADAVLVPSKFEPAGLVQLEAMRYGAAPIVRKTGGLADTVKDHAFSGTGGTGFVFKDFDAEAMMIAITRAFENFQNKTTWRALQRRMMNEDFSWGSSAREYAHLFDVALASHRRDEDEKK